MRLLKIWQKINHYRKGILVPVPQVSRLSVWQRGFERGFDFFSKATFLLLFFCTDAKGQKIPALGAAAGGYAGVGAGLG